MKQSIQSRYKFYLMARGENLNEDQKKLIQLNATNMTAKELATLASCEVTDVYNYCSNNHLKYVRVRPVKAIKHREFVHVPAEKIFKKPEQKPEKIIRPLPVYSNRSPYGIADELRSREYSNRVII